MATIEQAEPSGQAAQRGWYALFSRGEHDWLRHNARVREAVRKHLPGMLSAPDLLTGPQQRQVSIPLHLLEHARFRLAELPGAAGGVGCGGGRPGDMLAPGAGHSGGAGDPAGAPQDGGEAAGAAGGGSAGGPPGVRVQLEYDVSDIVDWLWEEMRLPLLRPTAGAGRQAEPARNGWDTHGPAALLDRRRTLRQAVRRRAAAQQPAAAFADTDLRYHAQAPRPRAACDAVVLCALDVSASMTQAERKLAKTFFFHAVQGLRRKYGSVAVRFIAHATQAWQFEEADFFRIAGEGGTEASSAFALARDIVRADYGREHYNAYLFYASDGENYSEDRAAAAQALASLAPLMNYMGYLETVPGTPLTHLARQRSELQRLFEGQQHAGHATGVCLLRQPDDVWQAIRQFFVHAAGQP